jgi:hypothetical protein
MVRKFTSLSLKRSQKHVRNTYGITKSEKYQTEQNAGVEAGTTKLSALPRVFGKESFGRELASELDLEELDM